MTVKNLTPVEKTDIEDRLTHAVGIVSKKEIIKKILGRWGDDVIVKLFGGAIRDAIIDADPADYDVVIISDEKIRAEMFRMINKDHGGDLKIVRGGYRGTLSETQHYLIQFSDLDLVFVKSVKTLRFDYDVNTLSIQLQSDRKPGYTIEDIKTFSDRSVPEIVERIRKMEMLSLNSISGIMSTGDPLSGRFHQLYRVCKMYSKGFHDVSDTAITDIKTMYDAYKKDTTERVITESERAKRKFIKEAIPDVLSVLREELYP